ncbi:MAG: WD40/YVTN/BNR-like repeat-containing protein [Xanthobacteraceae bacterium]
MTVCLSTNGPSIYKVDAPPRRLLVATLQGVVVLERDKPGSEWRKTGLGLEGKHISSMMIEPRNGGVFAGVHGGTIHFSSDNGNTWERRDSGVTIPHIYSLGWVAKGKDIVLYAGTEPVSLFRSIDNGKSWEHLPAIGKVPGHEKWTFPPPPHIAHTKNFTFDPRNPDIFYATVEQGALLKTTDGGVSWHELASFHKDEDRWYKDVHRLAYRPSNPDEFFMATGMGVYHSLDAGKTWDSITGVDFTIGYPDQVIFSPIDERVIYMSGAEHDPSTWRSSHEAHGTVLRSKDSGRTWEDASRGMPRASRANIEALNAAAYPGGFTLFAGNTDGEVYASEDGGDSWTRIASGLKPISKGGHFRNLQAVPA